ncbi:hypothetical protein Poli38472_006606 [Pythium oligandrum]|uniref:Uncharacterized protein n=1 Tax=Pythium oligandrum TaxID=41045 RepID=A0A8K1FBY5_PYTOL|nr:hypothetical protein Poli38472_006606 [Pythium oligandrum]|eukprot:TMW56596.1 hypothetical protein Poli38472_006606 [Pythium oligandrum]
MKYSFAVCTALAALAINTTLATAGDAVIPSAQEALDAAKTADLPDGVTLTGSVEPVKAPASTSDDGDSKKEALQEWWGGAWGGWGGWGGFGPYRFGWGCGGLGGWAYPLGYWNAFGASLYGGGCGLGLARGGLYYC